MRAKILPYVIILTKARSTTSEVFLVLTTQPHSSLCVCNAIVFIS